jgi:hypothetical protein
VRCARCGATLPPPPHSRRDACASCGADLHACFQCDFYAPGAYNDCREPQADRVTDKERANFCDFFRPAGGTPRAGSPDTGSEVRARLDALFKKKP